MHIYHKPVPGATYAATAYPRNQPTPGYDRGVAEDCETEFRQFRMIQPDGCVLHRRRWISRILNGTDQSLARCINPGIGTMLVDPLVCPLCRKGIQPGGLNGLQGAHFVPDNVKRITDSLCFCSTSSDTSARARP